MTDSPGGRRVPGPDELGDLMAEDRASAQLLGLLAHFGDAAVPGWLLAADPGALPAPLSERARAGAASALGAAGPLERPGWLSSSDGAVRLSDGVAESVREVMTGRERGAWLRAATALLHAAFPTRVGRPELRERCRALEPHLLAVAGRAAGGGRTTAEVVHLLARLGAFRRSEGEVEASLEAFRTARRLAARGDPVDAGLRAVLADEEANALAALDRWEEAFRVVDALLAIARESIGEADPRYPMLLANAATTLREGGEPSRAADLLARAVEAVDASGSPAARPLAAELAADRSEALLAAGRPVDAEEAARRAGDLARALESTERPVGGASRALRADWIRADALRETGRHEEATRLFRRVLEAQAGMLGRDHPDVGQKALVLARHLEEAGRLAEAADFYRRALAVFEASVGEASDAAEAARVGLARTGS